MFLKQSTASQTRILGPFVDDTDFKTLKTGLTIANTDVKLSKNGAASVNKNSGGGTHIVNGGYALTFDATDTGTVGELSASIAVSGALIVSQKFFVVEEAVYDALFGASALGYVANAPVNVAQFGGSNLTASSGRPEVNSTSVNGSATAAARLALAAARILSFTVDTAGFSPTNVAFETSTITEATADHYKDRVVLWVTGALADQQQTITAYALTGGRGRFTLTQGTEAAANGDTGIIV